MCQILAKSQNGCRCRRKTCLLYQSTWCHFCLAFFLLLFIAWVHITSVIYYENGRDNNPIGMKSVSSRARSPWVFNERQGNPHTTPCLVFVPGLHLFFFISARILVPLITVFHTTGQAATAKWPQNNTIHVHRYSEIVVPIYTPAL